MATTPADQPPRRSDRVEVSAGWLAVTHHGSPGPDRPTVLLLHGYPDDQSVWDDVVARLTRNLHVVTYDARGAGGSDAPADRSAYAVDLLVDDLVAVLDSAQPTGRVHLVGHDWGSVQLWEAVARERTDPRLRGRLGSFTSISGPPLDHVGTRSGGGDRRAQLRQLTHSWYVLFFQLPWLPELMWRRALPLVRSLLRRTDPSSVTLPWGPRLTRNAVPGLRLYRANLRRLLRPGRDWRTPLPVQLVVPTRDGFVLPDTLIGLEHRCSSLEVHRLDAGHWVPRTHPDEVATLVADLVGRAGAA